MIKAVIFRLLEEGWSYDSIASRSGVCQHRIKHPAELTDTQENAILRLASVEAGIDLDECFEGEE